MKKTLLLTLIGLTIFISGCTTGQVTQPITCNRPYLLIGTECCLDQDDNSICDKDETTQPTTTTTATPTTPETTTPTTTSTVTTPEIIERTTAIVSKIVDGDTIKLQTDETVRLLGINTPEMGQPYYEESTNRLKELIEGKEVILEKDIDNKDQYGRLLRHVLLNNENIDIKLVREGLATVYIISPNLKYETELKKAENEAKNLKINIWKPPEQKENICDDRCIGISYFHWNAEGNDCDNLNDEYVILKNSCTYSCDLTGWTARDESSRDSYVFPAFIFGSETSVTLYTGCGTNTNTKLYWCSGGYSCNAIWNNDKDTLYLRNSNGELVLSHSYSGY